MSGRRDIRLLLADVDGTLVTNDKLLTEAAKAAVQDLRHAGIAFTVTSSLPPRGLRMLIEPLALQGAIAGLNGGIYVNPDLSVIECHPLDPATAKAAVDLILDQGLDVWVYTEKDWFVRQVDGPHVAREAWILKFAPEAVASFTAAHLARAIKIVGVSDDLELVAAGEQGRAEGVWRKSEHRALAALLPRRDRRPSQQRGGRGHPFQASQHSARADRHNRGHAERCPDVPKERLFHRHGQFQRRGEGAGKRGDR